MQFTGEWEVPVKVNPVRQGQTSPPKSWDLREDAASILSHWIRAPPISSTWCHTFSPSSQSATCNYLIKYWVKLNLSLFCQTANSTREAATSVRFLLSSRHTAAYTPASSWQDSQPCSWEVPGKLLARKREAMKRSYKGAGEGRASNTTKPTDALKVFRSRSERGEGRKRSGRNDPLI